MNKGSSNFYDDVNVVLTTSMPSDTDVVFLPTNEAGTPGQLNRLILEHLSLKVDVIPRSFGADRQYEIVNAEGRLICFVITVGAKGADFLLKKNLSQALNDKRLSDAKSLWIPLMGTGAGGLPLDASRRYIISALAESQWWKRKDVSISLSFPPGELISENAIEEFSLDVPVLAALQYAAALRIGYKNSNAPISTTLLFFALTSSDRQAAPPEYRNNFPALLFGNVVHSLAGSRYFDVWRRYYPKYGQSSMENESWSWPVRVTANVSFVLSGAAAIASAAERAVVSIGDVIRSLMDSEQGRYRACIEEMGVPWSDLRKELDVALSDEIDMAILNDVAAVEDRLGYDRYAEAIKDFLVDAATIPPISISIQAPWGAGKSSLMRQVRNKLDSSKDRTENKSKAAISKQESLKIRDALDFLNQAGRAIDREQSRAGKLWTIWFNAWKYDTSEQVWAGLVDAIVSQICERLTPFDRELFLFRLQLARIDDGIVRRKIYDRIVVIWWQKIRLWMFSGVGGIASLIGLHKTAVVSGMPSSWLLTLLAGSPVGLGVALAVGLAYQYKSVETKTKAEPAAFSLAEYLQVPDYHQTLGMIHHIHRDLLRVLSLTPRRNGARSPSPLVIFIDDLDRCSPGKIASVVEGVSMFLASEDYRCMFVIGMDPQMIAAALEEAHGKMRERLPSYERTVPLGWRFMDKFIQLPFTIPPTNEKALDSYLDALTNIGAARSPSKKTTPAGAGTAPGVVKPPMGKSDPNRVASTANGGATEAREHVRQTGAIPERASPGVSPRVSEAMEKARESRDVGELIRKAAGKISGNPREIKRLANLARLYLGLRNARRKRQPSWQSPELDEYARWIILTLRWPEMMRWLQWGVDESVASVDDISSNLVERRLRILREKAGQAKSMEEWRLALKTSMGLDCSNDLGSDWTGDPKLFEFFQSEARLESAQTLHVAIRKGFW